MLLLFFLGDRERSSRREKIVFVKINSLRNSISKISSLERRCEEKRYKNHLMITFVSCILGWAPGRKTRWSWQWRRRLADPLSRTVPWGPRLRTRVTLLDWKQNIIKAFCVIAAAAETKSINTLFAITKNAFPYLRMLCVWLRSN